MVAENLRVPVPAKLIFFGGRISINGLQIRHDEFRHVRPIARRQGLGREVVVQRVVLLERRRRRHIALDRVVKRRHIGRALDRGVAAQRHHTGAGPADIAQQKLQQRAGANDLYAISMLRPGNGISE